MVNEQIDIDEFEFEPKENETKTELNPNVFEGKFMKFMPGETKELKLKFHCQYKAFFKGNDGNMREVDGLEFGVIEENGKPAMPGRLLKSTSKPLCRKLVSILARRAAKEGFEFKVRITRNSETNPQKVDYIVAEL